MLFGFRNLVEIEEFVHISSEKITPEKEKERDFADIFQRCDGRVNTNRSGPLSPFREESGQNEKVIGKIGTPAKNRVNNRRKGTMKPLLTAV